MAVRLMPMVFRPPEGGADPEAEGQKGERKKNGRRAFSRRPLDLSVSFPKVIMALPRSFLFFLFRFFFSYSVIHFFSPLSRNR